MGTIPDDLGGIFDHLREAALTMQQGGGVGMDFSTIRPNGARVQGVGADASGPLSFMDVWDGMCRTIMSAGQRRGAMMGCLRIDHPDIEAFIDAKREPSRLRNFNLSVLVTDASWRHSMRAKTGRPVQRRGFITQLRPARFWDRLMHATYDYAEPGVIFIDRVNALNNWPIGNRLGQQSVRRTDAAAVRRVPARIHQPGQAGAGPLRTGRGAG